MLFLADAKDPVETYGKFLALNDKKRPHIVVINKTDMVSNERLLKKLGEYGKYQESFLELVPVSAKKGHNLTPLLDVIAKYLPESPYLYDPELLTTETVRDIYKEMIREALFNGISDEVPYEADVMINEVQELPDLERISATIVVEKQSQKMIVVGKEGSTIRRIGKAARERIEEFSGKQVHLDLFVKVQKGWSKNKQMLAELGYEE